MSQLFERYERQYCELSANLSRKCTSAGVSNGGVSEQKKQKISELKSGFEDAEALIRKMDHEARTMQPNMKASLLAKLREYKTDLSNLKAELKKNTSDDINQALRDDFLESGRAADTTLGSEEQRGRVMVATEMLNKGSERIKESRRTMLETEELGVSILQDLHQQRQSLLHAHHTLHGVDDNIGKSKRTLAAMARRMDKNKWIAGGLIAALLLSIIIILYIKLSH